MYNNIITYLIVIYNHIMKDFSSLMRILDFILKASGSHCRISSIVTHDHMQSFCYYMPTAVRNRVSCLVSLINCLVFSLIPQIKLFLLFCEIVGPSLNIYSCCALVFIYLTVHSTVCLFLRQQLMLLLLLLQLQLLFKILIFNFKMTQTQ